MAGVSGQPSVKPQDLKSPVPNTGEDPGLDAFDPGLDNFDAGAIDETLDAAPAEPAGYNGFGADAIEGVANALPIVGGIAGGIAGGLGGTVFGMGVGAVPGGIGGAALGAAGGQGWKQVILQDILKRVPQQGGMERAQDIGIEGAVSGAGSLVGLGVSKGAAKLAGTKLGSAALAKIADKTAGPLAAIKGMADRAIEEIYEPVAKVLATKVTPLTGEEAGNAIKSQFAQGIKQKYAGFVKAYSQLDDVAANIPLQGAGDLVEVKGGDLVGRSVVKNPAIAFTDKVRNEALDMPQGTYKAVKEFADRFDQSVNGKDFVKVMGDLRKTAEAAAKDAAKYNSNAVRDRAASLMKFADDAEGFYEDKIVGGIAKRVANGKATMQEIEGFQRMMAQQQAPGTPIDPKNLAKYTKSVAKDYLDQKDAVKVGYAKFRGLLEDIGDVAKVKSSRMGPNQFVRALDEVPPDLLAERAFDPKNAGAVRVLKTEFPQVYDTIVKNKMSGIIANNTDVAGEINYKGIAETIKKMPESAQNLLMSPKEYEALARAVNDPRHALLKSEQTAISNKVALGLARIGEIMRVGGKEVSRSSGILPKTSAAVGQGAFQLGQAFRPGISQPEDM